MTRIEKEFIDALNKYYRIYMRRGARSPNKLKPVHSFIAKHIDEVLNDNEERYKIYSLGFDEGKEYSIDGRYYPKKEDVVVLDENDQPILAVSFRFVVSNYFQNANNYFENLIGEIANIKSKNIYFGHILVLRAETPYYDENGKLKRIEELDQEHLEKYLNLMYDDEYPYNPDILSIFIVKNKNTNSFKKANLNKLNIDDEIKNVLETDLSLEHFFDEVRELCKNQ